MAKQLYKTVQGITDASIKTETGKLLVLPTAAGSVFNPGQEIQEVEATSRLGEKVIVDTYNLARKPTIQLDWQQKNLQLMSLRLGLEFEQVATANTAKVVSNGSLITKNSYSAAADGYEGNGMPADQAGSVAYVLEESGTTTELVRQPYASFNPATPLSFAQGANGARMFSNDLINKYVAYEFPHALSNVLQLSETPIGNLSLTLMTIMSDRSILQFNFPSVSVKLDEGDINLTEAQMQVTFRIQDDGSTCLPYEIIYKGTAQRRKCI